MSRRYRRPDLDSPVFWAAALGWMVIVAIKLAILALIVAGYLVWALIALPIVGVARLAHNDNLARKMLRSLSWQPKRSATNVP